MATPAEKRRRLRAILASGPIVLAPGCPDPLSARLVERMGIGAVHASGSVFHRMQGYADIGLLNLSEMVQRVTALSDAVDIPVIADGEEGFGSSLHVVRTVREYERAGVAAIHIEDSVVPKRPTHMGFAEATISRAEMVDKIRTAVQARTDPDLIIIARSQIASDFAEMRDRLAECLEAGADAFWVIPRDPQQIAELCRSLAGAPGLGVLPNAMTVPEYETCGVRCAFLPQSLPVVALHAQQRMLAELLRTGAPHAFVASLPGVAEMSDFYMNQGAEGLL